MTRVSLWVGFVLLLVIGVAQGVEAQAKPDGPDVYGAKNTFGVMAEYANDSSYIVLGSAENVKFGAGSAVPEAAGCEPALRVFLRGGVPAGDSAEYSDGHHYGGLHVAPP